MLNIGPVQNDLDLWGQEGRILPRPHLPRRLDRRGVRDGPDRFRLAGRGRQRADGRRLDACAEVDDRPRLKPRLGLDVPPRLVHRGWPVVPARLRIRLWPQRRRPLAFGTRPAAGHGGAHELHRLQFEGGDQQADRCVEGAGCHARQQSKGGTAGVGPLRSDRRRAEFGPPGGERKTSDSIPRSSSRSGYAGWCKIATWRAQGGCAASSRSGIATEDTESTEQRRRRSSHPCPLCPLWPNSCPPRASSHSLRPVPRGAMALQP